MNAYNTSSYGNSSSSSYPYPHTHHGQVPGYIYGNGSVQSQSRVQQNVYDVSLIHHQAATIHAGHGSSNLNTNYPYPTPPVSYPRHTGSTVALPIDVRNAHSAHYDQTGYGSHDQLVKRNGRRRSVNSGDPYPYPVPGRRTSQSDGSQSQPRPPRKHSITSTQPGPSNHITQPGPSNHIILPQEEYLDDDYLPNRWLGGGVRLPAISFQVKGFPELGVRMSAILGGSNPLVGGEDKVLLKDGYKEIRMRLLWPGYADFERRIKTRNSQISRSQLLLSLANAILDFITNIQARKIPIDLESKRESERESERGSESYQINIGSGKPGFTGNELFITRLLHRGGSNWQPEIWCPTEMPQYTRRP